MEQRGPRAEYIFNCKIIFQRCRLLLVMIIAYKCSNVLCGTCFELIHEYKVICMPPLISVWNNLSADLNTKIDYHQNISYYYLR